MGQGAMSSGVTVNDECMKAHQDMKIKKLYKYVIFYIKDKKTIEIEKLGNTEDLKDKTNDEIFAEFCTHFPAQEARYAVFDCPVISKSGMENNKLIFIMWNSDAAPVKSKMLYASSKDALKKKLTGIENEFQATEKEDLKLEDVAKKAGSCA